MLLFELVTIPIVALPSHPRNSIRDNSRIHIRIDISKVVSQQDFLPERHNLVNR